MTNRFASVALATAATILNCAVFARSAEPGAGENVLQQTSTFALGGIGVAGTMSEGERALRELLGGSDALLRLDRLLSTAGPAGQLYALLGLRLKDRAAYDRAITKMGARNGKVETARGCILSQENFADLLKEIDSGQHDQFLDRKWRN